MSSKYFIVAMALAVSLSACASGPKPLQGQNLAVMPIDSLPPPTSASARSYHVGGFDTLTIDVYGVEDLSHREVQADSNGRIDFPLAGAVEAKGMTLNQLDQELERRLARYVRDPHVTVNLKETVSQVVTVDGDVKHPGSVPVVGDMTLMRAIARAEGVSEDAKLEEVVVFRTVGTQKMAALYDLGAIRAGRYADPEVYPDDIVVVGDSPQRRALRNLLQVGSIAVTPLVVLLQRL